MPLSFFKPETLPLDSTYIKGLNWMTEQCEKTEEEGNKQHCPVYAAASLVVQGMSIFAPD